MTRRRRLRRRSFPVRCAPAAGGRAAQGYGAAPPASRLLRIACGDGPAGPALTPGTPAAPRAGESGQAPACPSPARGASGEPAPTPPMTQPTLTTGEQQPHYRHQGPGAELRDRHPRELADRQHPNRGRGRDADRARQAGNQGSTQGPRPAAGHPLRACRSAANQSSSQCGGRSMRSRSSSSGSVYSPQPASVSSLCSGSRGLPAAVAASSEPVEPRRKDMRLGYVSDSA